MSSASFAHSNDSLGFRRRLPFVPTILGLLSLAFVLGSVAPARSETIKLFNGHDLDGWYTYTTTTHYENPGAFTVQDGMIRVAGGQGETGWFGGVVTKKEYANYKLNFEFKWGHPTYGTRLNKARDAGVLVHCVGPNEPGPWMTSYEFQIIEGGVGDLLVVNTSKTASADQHWTLTLASEGFVDGKQQYFKEGGMKLELLDKGRLNWWGRDPAWKDTIGYRGPKDVESPSGEWTRCEIVARGDTLAYYVNGTLVNRATGLSLTKGKIFFQTEGAEVWYRNIELTPLE